MFYLSHLLQRSFAAPTCLLASDTKIFFNLKKKHIICFNVCHYVTDQVFGILNKSDINICVGLVTKSH